MGLVVLNRCCVGAGLSGECGGWGVNCVGILVEEGVVMFPLPHGEWFEEEVVRAMV